MWQVRWKNSCAMLRLTGRRRRKVGPSSMRICLRTRSSRFRLKLCSALAAADLMALATSRAACFGENSRCARASATRMPFTESATSLALRGVRRTNLCTAETSIVATLLLQRRRFFGVGAMAAEVARGRELTEPVADHVLADEDGHVLASVVHRDGVADHVGIDGRGARPGANHLLVARRVHLVDLLFQGGADERPLLQRTRHLLLSSFLLAAADDELVGGLLRLARAIAESGLAPRGLRVAAGPGLPFATTVRMVAGVHRRTSNGGPDTKPAAASCLAARLVLMLDVTDLADRGLAANMKSGELTPRAAHDVVVAFLREQLGGRAGRADELAAATERQLDVVDGRTDRD